MKRGVLLLIGLVVLAALATVVILLTRNRGTAPSEVTLEIWSPFDEGKIYETISQDFLAQNPGVKLEFKHIEAKDAKEYEAKVVNAIADGEGPNIWLARFDWIPKHAAKSQAAIAESREIDPVEAAKASLEPAVVGLNVYEGELYGIPLFADSLAIIYNSTLYDSVHQSASSGEQTVLSRLATTWEELRAQTDIVSQARGNVITRSAIALGTAANTFASVDVLGALLNQSGATVLSADKKSVALNLAQFKDGTPVFPATEALEFFTGFAKPEAAHYSWSAALGDPVEAFIQGKTGALIGYYSTLQAIQAKTPDFTIKVAPLIQKAADHSRVDFAMGWTHLVNRQSVRSALAWNYLATFLDGRHQDKYAEATGRIAARKQAAGRPQSQLYDLDLAKELFRLQLQSAKVFEKPEWQLVDEVLQDAITQVVNTGVSAQNSIDSAAERLKTLIKSSDP